MLEQLDSIIKSLEQLKSYKGRIEFEKQESCSMEIENTLLKLSFFDSRSPDELHKDLVDKGLIKVFSDIIKNPTEDVYFNIFAWQEPRFVNTRLTNYNQLVKILEECHKKAPN